MVLTQGTCRNVCTNGRYMVIFNKIRNVLFRYQFREGYPVVSCELFDYSATRGLAGMPYFNVNNIRLRSDVKDFLEQYNILYRDDGGSRINFSRKNDMVWFQMIFSHYMDD